MSLTRDAFAAWLDAYIAAWRSNDASDIGRLFSEDARYSFRAGRDPVVGRDAIVRSWLEDPDDPGTWEADYEPLAIDGDVHVATGWSRYLEPDGSLRDEYGNIFVCRFDDAGQCREFSEWFVRLEQPARMS
jgi:hypothetical protein